VQFDDINNIDDVKTVYLPDSVIITSRLFMQALLIHPIIQQTGISEKLCE
jgi:hypothetical protein